MRHRSDPGELTGLAPEAGAGSRSARVRIGVGAGVIILLVGLVAAVLVTTFAPRGGVRELDAGGGSSPTASGPGAGSRSGSELGSQPPGTASDSVLLVHVLGAVNRPGIVEVRAGSRVLDAIASAGGLTGDADSAGVNLARPVSDGEQLVVPRVGEVMAPPAPAGGGPAPGGKVNVNSASVDELQVLPRIGPALAQRIVDWRGANGRFASPADLLKVTGIGQTLFDTIKDLITV